MRGQRESLSTRDAFGKALAEKSEEYPNLVYLAADTLKSVGGTEMHCRYPNRALNIGISEQNMALMGAGLAASGAKVVLASYAVFSTLRILEQIRTFIAYPGLDVKIVAGLSGLSGGQEGVTHQGIEDIACLRSIPGLTIVAPADAASTMAITRTIIDYQGPVYMRLGRTPTEQIFETGYCFTMGKANLLQDGTGCTIIAAGLVMGRVLKAAELLQTAGYGSVRVLEMPCIHPIDRGAVLESIRKTKLLVTVEDHMVTGGLGSAVAEILAENGAGRLVRIGIPDCFAESGDYDELLDKYGLSPEAIVSTIIRAMENKKYI